MEHLTNETEPIVKNALAQGKSLKNKELIILLNEEEYSNGLKSFLAVKGIKFYDLYEAWKRSGEMNILGEQAIRRLLIKEYLHLSPEEKSSLAGSALVMYLVQIIQKKYLTSSTA